MDNVKQTGKNLNKTESDSAINERRVSENFPQIERVTDKVNAGQTFQHFFNLSRDKTDHSIKANFYFAEETRDCHPQPIDLVAIAEGDCPGFPGSDGTGTGFAVYPSEPYFSQLGGFVNQNHLIYPEVDLSSPGIAVPVSGYYSIRFMNSPGGVSTGLGSGCYAGIAINFGVVVTKWYGTDNPGLSLFSPAVDVYTVAYLAAGDIVCGFLQEVGIAFWTPSNLCGFIGGMGTIIELVGAA